MVGSLVENLHGIPQFFQRVSVWCSPSSKVALTAQGSKNLIALETKLPEFLPFFLFFLMHNMSHD